MAADLLSKEQAHPDRLGSFAPKPVRHATGTTPSGFRKGAEGPLTLTLSPEGRGNWIGSLSLGQSLPSDSLSPRGRGLG